MTQRVKGRRMKLLIHKLSKAEADRLKVPTKDKLEAARDWEAEKAQRKRQRRHKKTGRGKRQN